MGITAAIAAVTSVYSTMQQAKAQDRAAAASERQFKASEQKADVQNTRSVRQQIRQARLAQASMTNVAAQTGGVGGSGLAGGMSSLGSQSASNIGYMSQIAQANTAYGQAGVESAYAQADAATWGAIGSLSGTIFNAAGGGPSVQKLFS